jgi:Peptidase M10 serralysin C terminal/Bacterial pre-peptidase C-terminal domain/Metallo-peptidase family M12B Reprolysin-like
MCFACAARPGGSFSDLFDTHIGDAQGAGGAGGGRSYAPATWDQLAGQLTDGYWASNSGARHSFDVSVDRDITVDMSRLSTSARTIALNALTQWSVATGINFVETSAAPTLITETTDVGNVTMTARNISTNTIVNGTINSGTDVDYYRVNLVAGQTYVIGMSNLSTGSAVDSVLQLRNSAGSILVSSDDPTNANAGEYITFTATATGTYYVVADGFNTTQGAYELSIQTAADITFNDMDGSGAYAYSDITGNNITRSYVNIADNWSTLSMNDYMLQTYIHEIGHALGLGHQGNYNGDATYPANALFDNDSWLASVMSYFSQTDNTLVANDSYAFLATIMPADIIAIQNLYGAGPNGNQTGNTIWGPGGNLNNTLQTMLDMAAGLIPANPLIYQNQPIAFTIYDTGGTDTLNLSAFNNNTEILLTELQYSNAAGLVDNVVIARGTVIENAIGGAADESIVGNDFNNTLEGRGGNDNINGGAGADFLIGGAGADFLNGGAGTDTAYYYGSTAGVTVNFGSAAAGTGGDAAGDSYTSIEYAIGSNTGSDALTGDGVLNYLNGLGGDDVIDGGGVLAVNVNTTTYQGDSLDGGAGTDTLSYATALQRVIVLLDYNAPTIGISWNGTSGDLLQNFENLQGSAHNDILLGNAIANLIDGGVGTDSLYGLGSADTFHFSQLQTDVIADFEDGSDKLRFNLAIADSFDDFTIYGNGTHLMSVVLNANGSQIIVQGMGSSNVTLTADDFLYV